MPSQRVRPRNNEYQPINRGASLTIPVIVKDPDDNPIDLTNMEIAFTVKKVQYDFDRQDERAYIAKNFIPQEPLLGRFFIALSSKDTDFEPGKFFFDIQIIDRRSGMIYRIVNMEFDLVGGPTNRMINAGVGQWPIGDEITIIQIPEGRPIIVVAPMIAFDPTQYGQDLISMVQMLQEKIGQIFTDLGLYAERIERIEEILEN